MRVPTAILDMLLMKGYRVMPDPEVEGKFVFHNPKTGMLSEQRFDSPAEAAFSAIEHSRPQPQATHGAPAMAMG